MERISRMLRSGLAMVLAICMIIGACPIAAFASETTSSAPSSAEGAKKYVSLGDSMTNGYGLTGYDDPYVVNGFLDEVKDAYPYQLQKELNFDLIAQLATSAMRAEDLNYILNYPNVAGLGDPYTHEEFTGDDGDNSTTDGRWNDYGDYGITDKSGVANVAEIFQSNVAAADVISFCVGNANFGVFLLGRLTNAMGILGGDPEGEEWVNFENALSRLDASQKQVAMDVYNQAKALLEQKLPVGAAPLVTRLVDILGYGVASYLANAEEALDRINELNPEAEIIIVGIMNAFAGLNLDLVYEGKEYSIPMSAILAPIVNGVNGYLCALPTAKQAMGEWTGNTFYYAEAENVGMIVDTYKLEIKGDNVIRDRFITEVVGECDCDDKCTCDCDESVENCADFDTGMVWGMVGDMFNSMVADYGLSLTKINRADVTAYEADELDKLTPSQILSVGVYLAFEKAVLEAADMKSLDATAFLSLASGLDGVFGPVADSLGNNLDMDSIAASVETKVTTAVMAAAVANANAYYKEIKNDATSSGAFDTLKAQCTSSGMDANMAMIAAHYACANNVTSGIDANTVMTWVMSQNESVIGSATTQYAAETLGAAITDPLAKALTSDPTIKSLLNLFARMLIGNGIGCHPSAAGHDTLTDAIVEAYKTQQTTDKEIVENVEYALGELKDFLETYGPEYAEQAWQYAEEQGYIDDAEHAIEELIAHVTEQGEILNGELIVAVEAAIEALKAQGDKLQEQLDALNTLLAEKKAELETAAGEAAEQLKEVIAQIEEAIAQVEALIAQVDKQIAELNKVMEELIAAVKDIAEQVGIIIENAEDLAASIVELVETLKTTGETSIEALAELYENARESVLQAAETLEKAIELVNNQVADAIALAEQINQQVTALYENTVATLEQIISMLPAEVQAAVNSAAQKIQEELEAAKAKVNEELQAALDELDAHITEQINAKKAELQAILDEIDAHVIEKTAELTAAAEAQIAALNAAAKEQIEALNDQAEKQIETVEGAVKDQIAALEQHIAEKKAELKKLNDELEAAAEATKAQIEKQIETLQSQIEELNEQLKEATEETKAQIEKQIETLESEIEKLNEQLKNCTDSVDAQIKKQIETLEAEIAKLEAELNQMVKDLNAQVEAINAKLEADIKAINAKLEADIKAINDELQAKVNAIRAEIEAGYAETIKAIENAIDELEAQLKTQIEELNNQAKEQLEKLDQQAKEQLEKLGDTLDQAVVDVINGIIGQIEDQLTAVNNTVKEMLTSSAKEALGLAEQLGEQLVALGEEGLEALETELKEAMHKAFVKATTAEMEMGEESLYVALGDGSAAPESYAEKVAEQLKAEYGVENFNNYATVGNTVGAEIEAIAAGKRADIADADLITVGFSNANILANAIEAGLDHTGDYDWVELVGEDLAPYVQQTLENVYAEIEAAGIPNEGMFEGMEDAVKSMVEGFAYGAVEYAIELPQLIAAIRAVNTDAVVVIVGQYNPMEGVVLNVGVNETLDMSEYINGLVDAVADHGIAYCILTGDAIFVEAPEVDTNNTKPSWSILDLLNMVRDGYAELYPSDNGHTYIANKILDKEVLNIGKIEVEEPVEPEILWGDADENGEVTIKDVILMRQYILEEGNIDNKFNFTNADVKIDGEINMKDIILMRQHLLDGVELGIY